MKCERKDIGLSRALQGIAALMCQSVDSIQIQIQRMMVPCLFGPFVRHTDSPDASQPLGHELNDPPYGLLLRLFTMRAVLCFQWNAFPAHDALFCRTKGSQIPGSHRCV